MENKELETWLAETKAKNLSYEELEALLINPDLTSEGIYYILNGDTVSEKAEILLNQWQKEAEFSPKRGDRVLVWNEDKNFDFERIFLTEIKGTEEPIYVVAKQSETSFIGGGTFYTETYEHMKPLPTEQPKETDFKSQVIELLEKTIREYGEAKEVAVNEEDYGDAAKYILIKETFEVFLKVVKEQLC